LSRRRLLRAGAAAGAGVILAAAGGGIAPTAAAEPFSRERFAQLCLETARANVRPDGWVVPSQAYADESYLRDAYWTLPALGDAGLAARTFERFAAAQGSDGRLPTSLWAGVGDANHVRDDESSALFILMGFDLARDGRPPDFAPLARAAGFLLGQLDAEGGYSTGPGPEGWWLDTLSLARPDVVAYTQGVVAVALRAAAELGAGVPLAALRATEDAYRGLYRPQLKTLTLSWETGLRDVSSLVGDALSWRYFGRPLLPAEHVADTLAGFRRVSFRDGAFLGFRVVSQLDGGFMPLSWFEPVHENVPGQYHNGASWLLYDALALDTAARHGIPGAAEDLAARLRAEVRSEWALHEYLVTDPTSRHFGGVPAAWRTGYAWNAYVGTLGGA
jgi:hypothetical protein